MSRVRNPFALLGMLGLAALITVTTTPAMAANEVSITLTSGTRTASIANLGLTSVAYSHAEQDQTGTMVLTADDATGTAVGWNVTVASTDFIYGGTAPGGTDIPASAFVLDTPAGPVMTAGQAIDGTNGPFAGASGALDTAKRVIYANENGGMGTYTQDLGLTLTIPAQARVGDYTATLTVTIGVGPGA